MLYNLLLAATLAVAPTTQPSAPSAEQSADLSSAIADAQPGSRIDVGSFDPAQVRHLPITIDAQAGPKLILSDKPEYFRTGDGIALQERLGLGAYRLYLYHVPTPGGGTRHVTAVLENLSDGPVTVRFNRIVRPEKGGDYHAIGKAGLEGLLGDPNAEGKEIRIAHGDRALLDPELLEIGLETNDLIHGIYEFTVDRPVRLSVLQTSPGDDPLTKVDELELLPQVLPGHHPSGAGRGTYDVGRKRLTTSQTFDAADGPGQLLFADGENEAWIAGVDGITGEPVLNKGNYGVVYEIEVPYTSDVPVTVLTYNARAGAQWCGMQANVMRVVEAFGQDGEVEGPLVRLPEDAVRYEGPPEMVVVTTLPAAKEGKLRLLYSPPGASCLPTPIVLVPVVEESGD